MPLFSTQTYTWFASPVGLWCFPGKQRDTAHDIKKLKTGFYIHNVILHIIYFSDDAMHCRFMWTMRNGTQNTTEEKKGKMFPYSNKPNLVTCDAVWNSTEWWPLTIILVYKNTLPNWWIHKINVWWYYSSKLTFRIPYRNRLHLQVIFFAHNRVVSHLKTISWMRL